MTRLILRRLLILPIALLAINFLAFSYAVAAQQVQQSQNPFGSSVDASAALLPVYRAYLAGVLAGDWGQMPLIGSGAETVQASVLTAAGASVVLLGIAFLLSLTVGLLLGLAAVRAHPPSLRPWLPPLASLGLAAPSFFIGALGITLVLALYLRAGWGGTPSANCSGLFARLWCLCWSRLRCDCCWD